MNIHNRKTRSSASKRIDSNAQRSCRRRQQRAAMHSNAPCSTEQRMCERALIIELINADAHSHFNGHLLR